MIFETDLDYGHLYEFSKEELIQYIKENFVSPNVTYFDGFSFDKSVKLMQTVCKKMLKIEPSPEQWVFLLADTERLLCEACAGAGKTTMAQLRVVKDKLVHNVPGANVLALAYNTHAVEDMKLRHDYIIRSINNLHINELHRDPSICCYTFHSFCKCWLEDYLSDFGVTNKKAYLMDESENRAAMQAALAALKKKLNLNVFTTDKTIDSLVSLYSYTRETLTEEKQEAWGMCPNIQDLSCFSTEQIHMLFGFYTKYKQLKHKMDFTDLINNMYMLCRKPEVMERIRANYRYFVIDEYQDMTPSMLRIVRLILEGDSELGIPPYNESRLTCIGDGDQSIYGFRGTDPDNCIRFKDTFNTPGHMVKVTAMSENRRCPEEIIKHARAVIESNTLRIKKPIKAIREGGSVDVFQYISCSDEMGRLVTKLKALPAEELKKTCICYRNQSSSYMLGLSLVEAGVPFKMIRGHAPLTDRFSCSVFDVLNMLSYPDIPDYINKALYKVLPKSPQFTKVTISEIVNREDQAGKYIGRHKNFTEFDYAPFSRALSGFSDALQILETARVMHRNNKPMSAYMPAVIKLLRKYYLDWQMAREGVLTDEYVEYVSAWFSRSLSYDDFMKQHRKLLDSIAETSRNGVYCTTLHGLKGLEFENVYIIDLNDTIFPGTELNQSKTLSPQQKDALECEARRLFYVALTRSKQNLTLYFDSATPSRYIRFFTPNKGLAETYQKYMHEDEGFLVTSIEEGVGDLDSLLEDSMDLDNLIVKQPEEEPLTTVFTQEPQHTDVFRQLIEKTQQQDKRLEDQLGEERFAMIKEKSRVKNIVDRVLSEGASS